ADRAGRRFDRTEHQPAAREDAAVRVEHDPVLAHAVVVVDVKRVGVLHQELAPAHEAEARPDLVPELDLHLIQVLRQVAIRADLAADDVGDDLLVGRPEAEVALVAILDAQQLLAVVLPATRLLPQLRRADRRHENLLRAAAVHLLADDALDVADHAQAKRQQVVDAARHLPQHAGADHQLVTDYFGIGGRFFQRRNERASEAHADWRDLRGCRRGRASHGRPTVAPPSRRRSTADWAGQIAGEPPAPLEVTGQRSALCDLRDQRPELLQTLGDAVGIEGGRRHHEARHAEVREALHALHIRRGTPGCDLDRGRIAADLLAFVAHDAEQPDQLVLLRDAGEKPVAVAR